MEKKHLLKRLTFAVAIFAILCAMFVPKQYARAAGTVYTDSTTIATVYDQSDCFSMQGFGVYGNYLYGIKANTSTNGNACIARVHKDTGATTYLTNAATGTKFFNYFGHANDLDIVNVNGSGNIFITTCSPGEYSLVRLSLSGTTATLVGHYNVTYNGSQVSYGGVAILHVDSQYVTLLFKTGTSFFVGKVGVNQSSGTITLSKKFNINLTNVDFGGVSKDLSGWVSQGFEYHDNRIFIPYTGNHQTSTIATSAIMVYNIEGASGVIENDPTYSFWLESRAYPGLFEIESLAICPYDGKLYFATNSRLSSSYTNYDGVHVVDEFVYEPDKRPSKIGNYRWEVIDNVLTPVTADGNSYNGLIMHAGSISGNAITSAQFCLSEPVVLSHDRRWIVEWKGSGVSNNNMLFSTESSSNVADHYYLFRNTKTSLIAMGYLGSSDGKNHNYGISLADHGIDGTEEHVYRLYNKLLDGGGNMVYLSVDGVELGALDNYYIGLTSQNSTSNWISGKDFYFSYIGTYEYKINNCELSYIQVWGDGLRHQEDEPDVYRWETQSNGFGAVSQSGMTVNTPNVLGGSCANGVLSNSRFSLNRDVVLTHDRPWVVEWQAEGNFSGGAMLLASHERSSAFNAPFLFRYTGSSLLAFGSFDGTQHNNYGVNLGDLGIDATVSHVYRLTNRIQADGSNMVYLSVDGVELSPMNHYFVGLTSRNTTSDWISGKDFTFSYMGTWQNSINDGSIGYFQIWENGIPADHVSASYRWEPADGGLTSITSNGFVGNDITTIYGSVSGNTITNSNFRMEKSVVLCHDKAWTIHWHSEGFTGSSGGADMILASSNYHNELNSYYVLRTRDGNFLAIGTREGSAHHNYGLKLSDYGIDSDLAHSYTLCNRVEADGSNMVYLLVDGHEIGALNNHYVGLNNQNETSNWISGKDFVFTFMGTYNYLIQKDTVSYIQINEGCAHSFGGWQETAPTCTAAGSRTRSCTQCGYVETEVLAAIGHSYQSEVTPPKCTQNGYTTYTCANCGSSYAETIAATGHTYVNGACTGCGQEDPDNETEADTVPSASITLKSVTLSLEDEIVYNLYFEIANMDVSEENMGLIIWDSEPAVTTINGGGTVIPGAVYVESTGRYGVSSMGIPAKNMGDMKYMMVYAKQTDGTYVYSRLLTYSARTYCLSRVQKSTNEKMRALCVSLMNYGAEAQKYFAATSDYTYSELMNTGFEEYQYLVAAYNADLLDKPGAVDAAKAGQFGTKASGFSSRSVSMSAGGSFALNYYFTTSVAAQKVTIYYWTAQQYDSVDVLTADNASGCKEMVLTDVTNKYWADYAGIAAKEMDQTVYACGVYEADGVTYSTGVIAYSLAKYCVNKASGENEIQALASAMAVYGYHAKTYFTN